MLESPRSFKATIWGNAGCLHSSLLRGMFPTLRGVAQSGSAPGSGLGGPGFESPHPDWFLFLAPEGKFKIFRGFC